MMADVSTFDGEERREPVKKGWWLEGYMVRVDAERKKTMTARR
jgi:hypothetical protein